MTYSLIIGLPTNGTEQEISHWISQVRNEIKYFKKGEFNIKIVICINNRKETQLKSSDNLFFIYCKKPGKNNAVNKILRSAKDLNGDIIYLSDDDVNFKPGSLSKNVRTLVSFLKDTPILVGSDFKANVNKKSLLIKILCCPYEADSDSNNFLSGSSICSWLNIYPDMPSSSTEIAEDSFVCIYYSEHFKNYKIIKPKGSITYFEPASNLRDWFWQQVRTYIGIEKSFRYFGSNYFRAQYRFAWRYAENPKFRKNWHHISFKAYIKLLIFRFFQKFVFVKGNRMMRKNYKVKWNKFRGED